MPKFRIIERTKSNELINIFELDQIFSKENRVPIYARRMIENALNNKHKIIIEKTEKPPNGKDYIIFDNVYQLIDGKGFTGFLRAIKWYMKEKKCRLKESKKYCDYVRRECIKYNQSHYCNCNSDGFRFNEKRIKICRNCNKPINEKKNTK